MKDHELVAGRFREWAADFSSAAPMYASLADRIADDPELLSLLSFAPVEQQLPVLLFASVHSLVLAEPDLPLGAFYPSVGGAASTESVFAVFRHLCQERRDELVHLVSTRVTQTNEVGRCRLFMPALSMLEPSTWPLSLVDVGASAGLNLFLDRYRYVFTSNDATGMNVSIGYESQVELAGVSRGPLHPPELSIPEISGRLGIDRFPIDLSVAADRNWLRACVWPEQTDRFRRLDAAIDVALASPPEIRTGDATAELGSAIAAARRLGHPVVMNSWVLNYLSDADRQAYAAELERLGRLGDLTWVFAESPGLCAGLPFPSQHARPHLTVLMMVTWRGSVRAVRHLADCHPHGEWLVWVDEPVVESSDAHHGAAGQLLRPDHSRKN